jgi:hypothetical protein
MTDDIPSEDLPGPTHITPEAVSDATIAALRILSEALETCERARGHLYAFHQLTGTADFELGDAARALREAGHDAIAGRLEQDLIGRNVLTDRWTFQILEDYDDNYWSLFRSLERAARDELVQGRRHLYEARLKEAERTAGHPAHSAHS